VGPEVLKAVITMTYSWVESNASSWKVSGSILDYAFGFSNFLNPSSRIMSLGFTQSLTEVSTRNLLGSKALPGRIELSTLFLPHLSLYQVFIYEKCIMEKVA
jgi:hypothetical protein